MQIKYNAAGGHYGSRSEVRMAKGSVVRDSGIGIAREDLEHIFDRCWRADKVRSRGVRSRGRGGAGLGLAIARWIVERHQGTIEVSSEIGRSIAFTIKLPSILVAEQDA